MKKYILKLKQYLKEKVNLNKEIYSEQFIYNHNFNLKKFAFTFLFFTPMYSLLYYEFYLGEFNVNYFLYLSPEDLVFAAYKNILNVFFILILILFSSLGLVKIFLEKKTHKKGLVFIIVLCASIIEAWVLYRFLGRTFYMLSLCFLLFLFINYFSVFKQYLLIYSYIIIASFFFIFKGKHDLKIVKSEKMSFDIILENDEYLMRENDKCIYWLGKLSKTIFIYDRSIGKVRIIPFSRVQEIRYTQNQY
ncbi:hypothetical protein ACE1MK_09240 [Tenacibaculum maritimum]|uniref:hypothetical protein n=1 Tax=Tenacibaculum maritimum TaxID=107401 RepID=UPI001330C374|nr:hypothetical protein [Tenacibaculum maritimum]